MKKIITIGGGTGSYTVLSGLKHIPNTSLTALVSMADDGGSTGILRDELGVLPPGDIRQCLVALSSHSDIVRELMNYRFTNGSLVGHSFGNIFLAALEKVTGDFIKGVEIASEILKVQGKVIPSTSNKAELVILLKDGTILEGENKINHSDLQELGIDKIFYKNEVHLNENAAQAINEADYIILGPGNYYCSLIPNLIVKGFKEVIKGSKAKLILIMNLTNKHGHNLHWNTDTYITDIEKYLERKVDIIIVNNQKPSKEQVEKYMLTEGDGVLIKDTLDDSRVIRHPLLSTDIFDQKNGDKISHTRSFIRHNPEKLTDLIKKITTS